MDENNLNQQKPLRRTSNRIKDIYDTYVKNDKTRNIPITDDENDQNDDPNSFNADSMNEEGSSANIDEKILTGMSNKIDELAKSLSSAESRMQELQKENTELKELSLRKTAELENFRKRSQKEKSEIIEYANQKLLASFVEILDDLTTAVNAAENSTDSASIKKGVELIYNKAKKLFDEAGVKPMQFENDTQFDVNYHDALMMSPSEKPEGTVLQVLQNGYLLFDKVLRHAKVITSSGVANN